MKLNIICGNREERKPVLLEELKTQNISDYELWDGFILPHSVVESINKSHKMIVEYALLSGWDEVCIAEDDIKFSHPKSWEYFLNQKPKEYDLYLGSVFLGQPDENGIVTEFTGMTIYSVSNRFYEKFLSVPDNEHIDKALANLGLYYVCQPFIATQWDGFSSNTGKHEKYGDLVALRNFYNG